MFALAIVICASLRAEDTPGNLTLDLGKNCKLDLVLIPAGTFEMGTPEKEDGHKKNETLHTVTLTKPFYMGIKEVTQDQYDAIMADNPSKNRGPALPVERVTWDEATKFCEKLSEKCGKTVQLPTEAQWEYACRGGTKTTFNTGETITTAAANFNGEIKNGSEKGENRDKTLPAGSFKPNAFGLFDMHGNVWEWCRDWYDENAYSASTGSAASAVGAAPGAIATGATATLPGTPAVASAPIIDPEGPAKSSEDPPVRVARGGSYYSLAAEIRSGIRDSLAPAYRNAHGGFRVMIQAEKTVTEK